MRHKLADLLVISALVGGCAGSARETERSNKRLDLCRDMLQKQDAAAETECKKAIALDPENDAAHMTLGLVYLFRANRNVALLEISDCLQGAMAQGLRDEANEQMRQADKHFSQATELAPDYGEAWLNRGAVAAYFGDWAQAVDYDQKALANLARLEKEELALANLGWAYFKKGDHPKAATSLLQATQRDPTFCLGTYRLAEVLFQSKEYEDARERLAPFLEDPKKCPIQQAQYLGGQLHLRVGDPEAAAKAFQTCVAMAPKSCVARQCETAMKQLAP